MFLSTRLRWICTVRHILPHLSLNNIWSLKSETSITFIIYDKCLLKFVLERHCQNFIWGGHAMRTSWLGSNKKLGLPGVATGRITWISVHTLEIDFCTPTHTTDLFEHSSESERSAQSLNANRCLLVRWWACQTMIMAERRFLSYRKVKESLILSFPLPSEIIPEKYLSCIPVMVSSRTCC